MPDPRSKAVVLLSGGLDSATTAWIAAAQSFDIFALTIRYGQRHAIEIEAARRVARAIGVRDHVFVDVDLRALGGSALTDSIDVPKADDAGRIGDGIPVTYVPARNTVFLSLALGYAEVIGARDVFVGMSAVDYSGYPDCRPEFVDAFNRLADVATKCAVQGRPIRVHAPLMELSKEQIIREGIRLGVDYGLTHSCYDPTPDGLACGFCESCLFRKRGFQQAGVADPIRYV